MKTRTLLFALLIISFTAYSQEWIEFTTSESTKPSYELLKSSDTIVEFEINVTGMFSTVIDTFNRVQIKDHTRMDSLGFPELPVISYLVAIPSCDSVMLDIELLDSIKFSNFNIYPAPELVPDTTVGGTITFIEQFSYDSATYGTDYWFPGTATETVDKGAIRAQDAVRVLFYPLQFNPVKKEIWVYSKAKITLTFYNPSGKLQKDVGIFNEVVGNTLINYNSNGLNASISCGAGLSDTGNVYRDSLLIDQKISYNCDYMIITTDDFFYNDYLWDLAKHRASFNGFDVVITRLSSIYEEMPHSLFDFEKIQKLIENTYNNENALHTYDGKLAYVNLFGDVLMESEMDGIPTYYEEYPGKGGYDIYFTQLTYDSIAGEYDIYPDLMIGRCSVDNTEQVKNVVHKILHYKPDILAWKNNMLNIVGTGLEEGEVDVSNALLNLDEIIDDKYDVKLAIPNEFQHPKPNWDTVPYNIDSIQNAYQKGHVFINYFGHGSIDGWISPFQDYSAIPDNPNYNLPFVISGACYTGAFQDNNSEDCLGEKLLCSDSAKGAIGFIGASKISVWPSMQMVPEYYKSVINNFSVVAGEALMEVKISKYKKFENWVEHYNLLGDPALNILYENSDSILPELVIKEYDIDFEPQFANGGDTVLISSIVSNMTMVAISDSFYISCYATNILSNETHWIGNKLIAGLDGNKKDTVNINWITSVYDFGYYDLVFTADTSRIIDEMNEDNNITIIKKSMFSYDNGLGFTSSALSNSAPVSFDITNNYSGEEIIFGRNLLSSTGDEITTNNGNTVGYTSIANLTNSLNFQIVQHSEDSLFSIGIPTWSYPCPTSYHFTSPPIICDFDQNGMEEILITVQTSEQEIDTTKFLCIENNGTLMWEHNFINLDLTTPIICSLNGNTTIIFTNLINKIYYAVENGNDLILTDSVTIFSCVNIENNAIIADLNQDGSIEIIVKCKIVQNGTTLNAHALVDLNTKSITTKIFPESENYYLLGVSDFNNDGNIEIITQRNNEGLLLLEYDLDSLNFIEITNRTGNAFASGDFNNDSKNDIVCEIKIDDHNFIRIWDASGDILFTIPSISQITGIWLSDIDNDNKIDFLCNSARDLFEVNLPNNGMSIGWPGQRGNVRNTGTLLQPAFYKSNDTVYWTDNISIPDTFEIPTGATVIVKPGTHVYAKEDAEFIVFGKLIAVGTEFHPIKFTANIMGAGKSYWGGITAKTNGIVQLGYCQIENAEVGLFLYSSKPANVENNTFKNNRVGLCAYASSPRIIENYFTQNSISIACQASSKPYLVGGTFSNVPYYNGIINNDTAIAMYNSIPSVKNGYNDIYNDTLGIYLVFMNDYPLNKLNISSNYYGSSDTNEVKSHLCPSSKFIIIPLLDSAQTNFKNLTASGPEELLGMAYTLQQEQKYEGAIQLFEQLIQTFPDENEALFSITGEFECFREAGLAWPDFVANMDNLLPDTVINTSLEKYASEYKNLALRIDGKYSEAIKNYETILKNPVSYYDSLYAIINLSNTLLESGSYKSTTIIEGIDESLMANEVSHIIRTKELLFSTFKDENGKSKKEGCVKIDKVYPNPTSGTFTTEYTTCNEGITMIDLYSSSGIKVFSKQVNSQPGQNIYCVDNSKASRNILKPGIYLLKVTNNNQFDSQRIILK